VGRASEECSGAAPQDKHCAVQTSKPAKSSCRRRWKNLVCNTIEGGPGAEDKRSSRMGPRRYGRSTVKLVESMPASADSQNFAAITDLGEGSASETAGASSYMGNCPCLLFFRPLPSLWPLIRLLFSAHAELVSLTSCKMFFCSTSPSC